MITTDPKLPVKIKPQEPDQPTPLQQHQNQSDADGDQINTSINMKHLFS